MTFVSRPSYPKDALGEAMSAGDDRISHGKPH